MHKKRGENWTAEEKDIFIEIMKGSARIVECKKTDTDSNKRKQAEWYKVQKKFEELTGKMRHVAQLKGFWRRTRMIAKQNVFRYKRALLASGGGERPPSPSQEEQIIMEMCPTDFVTEENDHNSDGIYYKNEIINKTDKLLFVDSDCVDCPSKPPEIAGSSQQEDSIHSVDIDDEEIIFENAHNTEVNKSTPHRPQKAINRMNGKTKTSCQTTVIESNIDIKEETFKLLEEEYALKLCYQRKELCHQELRHKLEIDILMLEKEKKEWELKLLKK